MPVRVVDTSLPSHPSSSSASGIKLNPHTHTHAIPFLLFSIINQCKLLVNSVQFVIDLHVFTYVIILIMQFRPFILYFLSFFFEMFQLGCEINLSFFPDNCQDEEDLELKSPPACTLLGVGQVILQPFSFLSVLCMSILQLYFLELIIEYTFLVLRLV